MNRKPKKVPWPETTHGEIQLHSISRVTNSKFASIFIIDCISKYPIYIIDSRPGGATLNLMATQETLKKSETLTEPTVLKFEGDWDIVADVGRYTVILVVYRWQPKSATEYFRTSDD